MSRESNEIYEFGPFRLNVGEHRFDRTDGLKNGNLPEKAFQTLTVLVRNHGNLVTKDELLESVWPDTIVEENNLDKAIHAIRHALGEKPGKHKYIETVRKHGYRFVADVRKLALETKIEDTSADVVTRAAIPTAETQQRGKLRASPILKFAAASVAILGFFAIGYYFNPFGNTSGGPRSIAVLPVMPIDSANRNELYEFGISESVINRLSSMKGFVVRPLSATRQYSDTSQDPIAAGREQKVDYVLTTNYQLDAGKIRITSQLFNVASGQIEETYKNEKDNSNLFAMQDAVASEIGKLLLERFGTTFSREAPRRGTTNEDAFRLYLHGKALTDNRKKEDALKAIESFEEAIRLDPNFARAYTGMAHAYISSGNHGGGLPREEYEKAQEAIRKASELDRELPEVYAGLAEAKFYEWDFVGSEKAFLRAIELDPSSDWVHEDYAGYLSIRGRFDEAIAEAKTALEINPNSFSANRNFGRILYLARRYDEAIIQLKRMVEVFNKVEGWLFLAHEMKGEHSEALEWFVKSQSDLERREFFQNVYKAEGWQGVKRKDLELARLNESKPIANFYGLARQSVRAGEKELAFDYLNKAFENHNGQLVMVNVEPAFDSIRDDPRFDELVRRIGLK